MIRSQRAIAAVVLWAFVLPVVAAPIHDAAKEGDVAAIAAALDSGADANQSNGIETPLFYAVQSGNIAAVRLLLQRGADVNAPGKRGTPLIAAVANCNLEMVNLLLSHGANARASVATKTALHFAAGQNSIGCVRELVEAGADVNALTAGRETPLHFAKRIKSREVVDYLMAHGVAPRPQLAPISSRLATASIESGQKIFNAYYCVDCHFTELEKGTKVGPNLWTVVGRRKASKPEFKYSDALKEWGGFWTYEDLNAFLWGPRIMAPGTGMQFGGIEDEGSRVKLIA